MICVMINWIICGPTSREHPKPLARTGGRFQKVVLACKTSNISRMQHDRTTQACNWYHNQWPWKAHYALFCKTRAHFGAHCEIVIKIALYLDP